MFKRHSRAGGNPVFERLSGYPIKSGMTDYAFRRTVVTCIIHKYYRVLACSFARNHHNDQVNCAAREYPLGNS